MKKLFAIFILLAGIFATASADNYSQLWKKVQNYREKDLPEKTIAQLHIIADKAQNEREWGHQIKAELDLMTQWQKISPDSFRIQFERFEKKAQGAQGVSRAVYDAVLGHIYKYNGDVLELSRDSALNIANRFFRNAMSDVSLLARTKAKGYEPLVTHGSTSAFYFNNDLLHIIGMEAEEYTVLNRWYDEHGNREAACLSALMQINKNRIEDTRDVNKSRYLHTLDSLISVYEYLPVAAEVAIERYNFMEGATDATCQEKVDYIDEVCKKWPQWQRINYLLNERQRLVLPAFSMHINATTFIPGKEQMLTITSLKNITELKVRVTKVNMTGDSEFDPTNSNDLKMIRSLSDKTPIVEEVRTHYGMPEYMEVRDTVMLKPLPLGVYLLEVLTNDPDIPVERTLLHVTNLQLIDMDLPENEVRLVVANATTGKPVAGARLELRFSLRRGRKVVYDERVMMTDHTGELRFTSTGQPISYRLSMGEDNADVWHDMATYWNNVMSDEEKNDTLNRIDLYTDRAIYRPGQTVKVSLIASNYNRKGDRNAVEGRKVQVVLTNAQYENIDTMWVTTDRWGVANTEMRLPAKGRTGVFSLTAQCDNYNYGRGYRSFAVEEYKRPQFFVEIDDYEDAYKVGDTITVRGRARTYTDLPVQNARVVYKSKSRIASWWRMYSNKPVGADIKTDTVRTDRNGVFEMRIPVRMPENDIPFGKRFFEMDINAAVTSQTGEVHEASMLLPVADKSAFISIEGIEDKICKEKKTTLRALLLNTKGKEVSDTLWYRIDKDDYTAVESNKELDIDWTALEKGEHSISLKSREDSLVHRFVLFSIEDERPVVKTDDWFYISDRIFARDKAVAMQVGTSNADQTVYYAIVSEKNLLESGRFVLNNQNQNRKFEYREEWGDGIALRYSWVRDGKLYTHSEVLRKPEADTTLKFEWTTFRDHTTPGNKELWTATVSDGNGEKVNAHMIATIYDKTLDALRKHSVDWMPNQYLFTPTVFASLHNENSGMVMFGEKKFRPLPINNLEYGRLDIPSFEQYIMYMAAPMLHSRPMFMANADMKLMETAVAKKEVAEDKTEEQIDVRSDFSETAVFMNNLVTDANGTIRMQFSVPESLTTWRLLGLVHDTKMRTACVEAETVVRKPLMVQPNMPRFIREGDKAEISAMVSNTTEKRMSGSSTLYIIDEAEKTVYKQTQYFDLKANENRAVTFSLPATLTSGRYVCKIVGKSGKMSDGEQNWLEVVSRKETIVRTKAFTQIGKGRKVIEIAPLFGKNSTERKVEVEYTENPEVLMVEALESMKTSNREDAVSLAVKLYAETIKNALTADSTALNIDATAESLKRLQNGDGSFSWCKNMPSSIYITQTVARILTRLEKMLPGAVDNKRILRGTDHWMDAEMKEYIDRLKKMEKEGRKIGTPSDMALDYLYIQAIGNRQLSAQGVENARYLLKHLKSVSAELTIYGKANVAVILAKHPVMRDTKHAAELLESIKEYSVSTEEMGRYFDTRKAQYSWCDYKIPTETAAIEALQTITPSDQQAIAEMQLWLLQEKRTQEWNTPINSASAVYAFFGGSREAATAKTDKGYYKKSVDATRKTVEFNKTTDGISWGAVYAECKQNVEDVESGGEGLTVKREVKGKIAAGEKVRVVITINSERDLDFVEVIDKRAACLEPVNQRSSWNWSYYESPLDKETVYYFNKLSKGKHVIETEYYVDRDGKYTPGTVTAKCAYAPEYCAVSK